MAFKLVGDQYSQINIIQKRRREDLLLGDIPEDEAVLMKNGRYACMVCLHRPVFDTVEMLAVHRRSRKHTTAAMSRLEEQQAVDEELKKRHQMASLAQQTSQEGSLSAEETAAPLVVRTRQKIHRALSKSSAPYVARAGQTRLASSFQQLTSRRVEKESPTSASQYSSSGEKQASSKQPLQYVFPVHAGSKKQHTSNCNDKKSSTGIDEEAQAKAKAFLDKCRSGWVHNNDGTWTRDPDAEFDSDEETPQAD